MNRYFITGIGTDIGKTIISALLTEALEADYWKPIQCGGLKNSDSITIKKLISNSYSKIHPESYLFKTPVSPHHAAELEGVTISKNKLSPPNTKNVLIIEGAGGILVPITPSLLFIDLIKEWECEIICVVKHYVGSINHTLLTLKVLKDSNLPIKGIIFNGIDTQNSEELIKNYTEIPVIGNVSTLTELSKQAISKEARKLSSIKKKECNV
jgi:dethiobiotin synthetase